MQEKTIQKHTIWTWTTKFLHLFILAYFFFYMFPFPLTYIPIIGNLLGYYYYAIDFLSIWFGENILLLEKVEKIEKTGSGDTTLNYVILVVNLVISLLVSLIVFAFTATKTNYKTFTNIVFIYARYYLAFYLLYYGFAKFIEGQFIFPDVSRLEQKIGDASPMGLLWTFMGLSKPYTVFSGICEVVGGLLLFFRRTTVLGAIISLTIMTNIVMLNFAYDVPVKLFSTHLALIAIFIISPNLPNLLHFFFYNKTSTLTAEKLELHYKPLIYGRIAFKSIAVVGYAALVVIFVFNANKDRPKHNLNGAYLTEEFVVNNDTILTSQKDSSRWNKFFIRDSYAKVIFGNDKQVPFTANVDTSSQIISLVPHSDTTISYNLKYDFINEKVFTVLGQFRSDSISATFNVKKPEDYELVKRDFHWINEYPYNK